MSRHVARRELLRGGLATAGLAMAGVPNWALPALAQDEVVVPFTDIPEGVRWETPPDRRTLDLRTLDGPTVPRDKWATTQHYGHPVVDPATFRLRVSGLVTKPLALGLRDLTGMGAVDLVAGFECSGNRPPLQGLCGSGRWTGVPLRKVLETAGLRRDAREVVFLGADKGAEEVEWRTAKYAIDVPFARSLGRDDALAAGPLLAWALDGQPLSRHQGFPLRLIVPGWYGVANVKWLSQIHVQKDAYLGKYQARWYRTVRGRLIDGEMTYLETAVTRMNLKSFIARVSRRGDRGLVLGVVLNDGTPLRSVEVKVDDGPWQRAEIDAAMAKERYGWKFFRFNWTAMTPGAHTLVSRVTDVDGQVQPTAADNETKRSFLEDNAQAPRRVMVA